MDFGSNYVLERVLFGLKCVLHWVRVSWCRPSRVIQNPAEQPPRGLPLYERGSPYCAAVTVSIINGLNLL